MANLDLDQEIEGQAQEKPAALNPIVAQYLQSKMDMGEAQQAASQNQLYAGLARAGGTLAHAISGAKGQIDDSGYNALDKNAQAPVQALKAEQEAGLEGVKTKSALQESAEKEALSRVDSPETKALYDSFKRLNVRVPEGLTGAQIISGFGKPAEFALAKFKEEEQRKTKVAEAKEKAGSASDRQTNTLAGTLRKEYIGLPVTKQTQDVSAAIQRVRQAASNPSPAGDLALIFNYMKMLDPGSTVREGEFANAQNATGVPDQIRNMYNRVKDGTRLGDDQRKDFSQQAEGQYQAQLKAQRVFDEKYQALAKNFGIDPSLITVDFSPPILQEDTKQGGGLPGVSDAHAATSAPPFEPDVVNYAKRHGITPEQAQAIKNKRNAQ